MDRHPDVTAWVKNDDLRFEGPCVFDGVVRKHRPDFLVRLRNDSHLLLEIKRQDDAQASAKRHFLCEWVDAVNAHDGFGRWIQAVSFTPSDVETPIDQPAP